MSKPLLSSSALLLGLLVVYIFAAPHFYQPRHKSFSPAEVTLTLSEAPPALHAAATATLTVTARRALDAAEVVVFAEGGLALLGAAAHPIGAMAPGDTRSFEIPFVLHEPGRARLRAGVQGTRGPEAVPAGAFDAYYFHATEADAFASPISHFHARRARLEHALAQREIGLAAYETAARALTKGHGQTTLNHASASKAQGDSLTISGTILWEDFDFFDGVPHPLRFTKVQLIDDNIINSTLGTVETDAEGRFSFRIEGETDLDLFLEIEASNDFFVVEEGTFGDNYEIQFEVGQDVSTDLDQTHTIDSSDDFFFANVFMIQQAMVEASLYIKELSGSDPDFVSVLFPEDRTAYCADILFDFDLEFLPCGRTEIFIDVKFEDVADWDVLHHEYGHHVMEIFGFDDNPGGSHDVQDNLSEDLIGLIFKSQRGKDKGTRLAWGEGWPSYFAVSLQQARGLATLNIHNFDNENAIGDDRFQDKDDAAVDYSMEVIVGGGGTSDGEDQELSVQRILYDLFDAVDDIGDEVSLGDDELFRTMLFSEGDLFTLSDFWIALTKAQGKTGITVTPNVALFGAIFEEHNVAPAPTGPEDNISVTEDGKRNGGEVTFFWDENGGGNDFRNDEFEIEFYNADFTKLLHTSGTLGLFSFHTPSEEDWEDKIFKDEAIVKWVVKGRQTDTPQTGDYLSGARTIRLEGAALAYVLDRSGSMSGAPINNAKAAARQGITLSQQGDDLAVVSFSTSASVNFALTTIGNDADRNTARNAVNGIFAGGGTSIGSGLLAACNELLKSDSETRDYVLMTDGQENAAPFAADALMDPCFDEIRQNVRDPQGDPLAAKAQQTLIQRIHSIAFGAGADQVTLAALAAQTGGLFLFLPDRNDPLALADVFLAIQENINALQRTGSEDGSIADGETQDFPFTVGGDLEEQTVTLLWDDEADDLDLSLITPSGATIDAATFAGFPGVDFVEGPAVEYFTIDQPDLGTWTARLTSVSGAADFALVFSGESNIEMALSFDRDEYAPGRPIVLSAALTEEGVPLTGAMVSAEVLTPTTAAFAMHAEALRLAGEADQTGVLPPLTRSADGRSLQMPDGTVAFTMAPLTLLDDGASGDGAANDGVYAAAFTDTGVEGSYTFEVTATGTAPSGTAFVREATQSTIVTADAIQPFDLTVASSTPDAGVEIGVVPADILGGADSPTPFVRSFDEGASVTLTAPALAPNGNGFVHWLLDGSVETDDRALTFTLTGNAEATAVYGAPNRLTINSIDPPLDVTVEVEPPDLDGLGDGKTRFRRIYPQGRAVVLTAPATAPNGHDFAEWRINGAFADDDPVLNLLIDGVQEVAAVYAPRPLAGDADGNGTVNHGDIIQMLLFIVGHPVALDLATADVDGNGVIDIFDVVLVYRFISGELACFPLEPGCDVAPTAKADAPRFAWQAPQPGAAEGTVRLPLDLISGQTQGFFLTMTYDDAVLDVHEVVMTGLPEGWLADYRAVEGELRVLAVGAEPLSAGTVATLHLGVPPTQAVSVTAQVSADDGVLQALDALTVRDIPTAYALEANYPNPFNPTTTIRYGLPEASAVTLSVYNVLGRRVRVLVKGAREAGHHEVVFEAGALPSGVYVYRLEAGAFTATQTMLLLK